MGPRRSPTQAATEAGRMTTKTTRTTPAMKTTLTTKTTPTRATSEQQAATTGTLTQTD
ncbi:hypothetical protein Trydic_g9533, partial [Trypoxylus dichotomus]